MVNKLSFIHIAMYKKA